MKFVSSKKDNHATHAQKVTVLSLGFELTGDVISKNDIRADGTLRGNIRTDKKVVVGEQASIEGDVWADEISISGQVTGDLFINGNTTIHPTAKVSGNILTHKIFIQQGAEIDSCIRTADLATIQKEKETQTSASSTIEKSLSSLQERLDKKEQPKVEPIRSEVIKKKEEVERPTIEEESPPVSRNLPRSW